MSHPHRQFIESLHALTQKNKVTVHACVQCHTSIDLRLALQTWPWSLILY